jgi:hypothetical protein
MTKQELITEFTNDKQWLLSNLRSAAHARSRAKYRYDVVLREGAQPPFAKNKLYVEMVEGDLQYRFVGSSGQDVVSSIDARLFGEVFPPQLTRDSLAAILPRFLEITSKRGHNGFHSVAEYLSLYEQQVKDLYESLSKEGRNQDHFWRYCYFCCVLLAEYYREDGYPDPVKAKKYHELSIELEYKCETGEFYNPEAATENTEFLAKVSKAIHDGLIYVADTVQHTTAIRAWLGFINLYRILFVFSRLAIKQGLMLANQLKWLETLGTLLHINIDVNALVSVINAPASIFNALSVGIFEVRLFIMLCEALKHVVLFATEKEQSRTKSERLGHELFIRMLDLYNDIAWATVNTLCNYAYLTGPVADWLTSAFLLLDAVALAVRLYLASEDYELKKSQYEEEKRLVEGWSDSNQNKQISIDVLDGQLKQLDNHWEAQKHELAFATAAALLLMSGYSAALLLTGPAAASVSFVACTVAVAMYLSSGKYGAYTKASLLENNEATSDAYSAFAWSMAKNSVMPLVMVTAFAVYWPAGLLLAAAYIAYESSGAKQPEKTIPEWEPVGGLNKKQAEENEALEDFMPLAPT